MMVQWSKDAGCFVYLCQWGCHDYDFESEHEATEAFLAHECRVEGVVPPTPGQSTEGTVDFEVPC